MAAFCGGIVATGVDGQQTQENATDATDATDSDLLSFPPAQFAPRLKRVSDQYPIYAAQPSDHFADWWSLYGEDLFEAWLERQ